MKIFGAVIILLCSVSAGAYLKSCSKRSLDSCADILSVMKYVRDEISINRTPTDIIYARLSSRTGIAVKKELGLYKSLTPLLPSLSDDEKRLLSEFSGVIGKGPAEIQRGEFDAIYDRFNSLYGQRQQRYKKNSSLYMTCSVFLGVLFIIIFI